MRNRIRFLLLTVAELGVGGTCIYAAWSSIATGVFSFTSRRRAFTLLFTRADDPFAFAVGVAVVSLMGFCMLAVALWHISLVLNPTRPSSQKGIAQAIARVEHEAPSGLKPLWFGLLIAVVAFALYAGV